MGKSEKMHVELWNKQIDPVHERRNLLRWGDLE